ncbi:MAG: ABC transporter ATP-binding protein [Anaerolineaceae bacterium]|nr:ABC transporter ATP-binding protein [Anaerolineaceae bacterium]
MELSANNEPNGQPILELRKLCRYFGGLKAVHEVDLVLEPHALNGLIGPNGSGKTTIFNVITGIYEPTAGEILLEGQDIGKLEPYIINQLGIARTFQNIRLFPNLTVLDNVRIAYHPHAGYGMHDAIMHNKHFAIKERELTERAQDFLHVFNLQDRQGEIARNLPYGEQRRLEIARALASEPKVLLLDEPAAGMNPKEVITLMDLIGFVRDKFDLTVLLIEHQMQVVMGICEKITVMDFGEVISRGTAKDVQVDKRVIEAYLGPGVSELSKKYLKEKRQQ